MADQPHSPERRKKKRAVTLKDIAADVGVSVNAVSSVLNPRRSGARVSDATRKAILKSARRLNYRRNAAASRLAGGTSRTLGILMAHMGSPYDGPLASGFEQAAGRRGYQCLVGCLQYQGVDPFEYVDRFMSHGVEGLLLCTVWNDARVKQALRGVLGDDLPVVFVDYGWEEFEAPLVCGNHGMGGRLIGTHLVESGHREVGLLTFEGDRWVESVRERMSAAREEIEAADGLVRECHIPRSSRRTAGAELARLLEAYPGMTAFVCTNDVEAQSVILSLDAVGLSAPDDVAVVGYDDLLFAFGEEVGLTERESNQLMSTPLTTVRQPLRRMGAEAAGALIDWVEAGRTDRSQRRVLDVELVARSSSRLPRRARELEQTLGSPGGGGVP